MIILKREILHIDVNNAFLSWSALDLLKKGYNIDIRTIPAIIGGDESRRAGIVLAKSQKAKEFGIKTGEPIFIARQKCPSIEIYPSNYKIYSEYSNKMYNILLQYTDIIERFSIDECFLDLTDALYKTNLYEVAKKIKEQIFNELGFTVNIGLSENKLLAKMASDFEKPNKIHTLYLNEIEEKMWKLPVEELFMLGRKSVPKLKNMNILTIGDLAKTDKEVLINKFGKYGKLIWEYANGIDESKVDNSTFVPKGIGNSVTLPRNIQTIEKIFEVLLCLTDQVTYRLRKHKLLANTVTVQLRNSEFKDVSHQKKLPVPTSNTKDIFNTAKSLVVEMYKGEEIRLVGLRVDKLQRKTEGQISFFNQNIKQEKLDKTLDSLKDKYGYSIVTRAGEIEANNVKKRLNEKNGKF